ncbi:MAG: M23 family metallopeptidase [Cellvibrionaceae bacterium]|nr:M23 family metallopeptidase [Cellvibrionaceae bacterium]
MWTNPTGNLIRQCDTQGCGHYGASRKDRSHLGVDYIATVEQPVRAVHAGVVTHLGHTYSDDLRFRYIAIKTDDKLIIRHLYVLPFVSVGMRVEAGEVIGSYQSLALRYPGITEHVHIDVWVDNGTERPWATGALNINPTNLIPLPKQPIPPANTLADKNSGFMTVAGLVVLVIAAIGVTLMGVV